MSKENINFLNINLEDFYEKIKGDNMYCVYISQYKSYKNFISKNKKKYNNNPLRSIINLCYLPALNRNIKKIKNIKNDICRLIVKPYNLEVITDNFSSYIYENIIKSVVYWLDAISVLAIIIINKMFYYYKNINTDFKLAYNAIEKIITEEIIKIINEMIKTYKTIKKCLKTPDKAKNLLLDDNAIGLTLRLIFTHIEKLTPTADHIIDKMKEKYKNKIPILKYYINYLI